MFAIAIERPSVTPSRVHATAAEIIAKWLAAGWQPGAPLHVQGAAIDARICKRRKCVCGLHGIQFHAYHRGDRYRGLAVCAQCGHGEEV